MSEGSFYTLLPTIIKALATQTGTAMYLTAG